MRVRHFQILKYIFQLKYDKYSTFVIKKKYFKVGSVASWVFRNLLLWNSTYSLYSIVLSDTIPLLPPHHLQLFVEFHDPAVV